MENVVEAPARYDVKLELSIATARLDIDDKTCMQAKRLGLKISIAADAHRSNGIDHMKCGIYQVHAESWKLRM